LEELGASQWCYTAKRLWWAQYTAELANHILFGGTIDASTFLIARQHMALWMNRAGRRGEWEQNFLQDHRIYLQWEELKQNLNLIADKDELRDLLRRTYPDSPQGAIGAYLGQIWIFTKVMKPGDWVGLPSKIKRAIHFGEITGAYEYDEKQEPRLRHYRSVKWFALDIPRSNFSQDILYSFLPRTICRINAEERIHAMAKNGWKPESARPRVSIPGEEEEETVEAGPPLIDLEDSARDEIAELVGRKFKGHRMAWLVEKVLKTQGYTTYLSPEGPDFGIDIMAAPGPLGFGQPRIVVQVKSGDTPIDRPTVDQLIGTMQNVQAEQGLFVSWGGFKSSVEKEIARQFFRVRFWDQQALIDQILENYDKLDEDLRAELPLKRIWTVAQTEETSLEE
jgi:restriction system protein